MLYNVGDKVLVIEDLREDRIYAMEDGTHSVGVVEEMMRFAGTTVTIGEATDRYYFLEEDVEKYWWTDEMFEGLAEDLAAPTISFYDFAGGDNRGSV